MYEEYFILHTNSITIQRDLSIVKDYIFSENSSEIHNYKIKISMFHTKEHTNRFRTVPQHLLSLPIKEPSQLLATYKQPSHQYLNH